MEKERLYLTEKTLITIKNEIQTELLKRGITAQIVEFKEYIRNNMHRIELKTEPFQTSPIMFKKLWIENFSNGVYIEKDKETGYEYYHLWISVHYSYEHFNGGFNGCKLFDFFCNISLDNTCVSLIKVQ